MNLKLDFIASRRRLIKLIYIPVVLFLLLELIGGIWYIMGKKTHAEIVLALSLSSAYFFCVGVVFQFSAVALACHERFYAINERIKQKSRPNSFEVINCVDLFKDLMKIIQQINADLIQPMILIFAFLLITTAINVYTTIQIIMKATMFRPFLISTNTVWTISYFCLFLIAIYPSEASSNEGEKFIDFGKEILWNKNIFDDVTKKDFQLFISTFEKSKLHFQTVFFKLNWKLVFQVTINLFSPLLIAINSLFFFNF